MVSTAAKRPAGNKRKGARATAGGQRRTLGSARSRQATLSPADIAEIAGTMRVPEGILQMVVAHYPEVARALARHRDSVA